MNAETSGSLIHADLHENSKQLSPVLEDYLNLKSIADQCVAISERIDVMNLRPRSKKFHKELQAAKTGLIVAQTAVETLLK